MVRVPPGKEDARGPGGQILT
ncbi:hypothetical protein GPN2_11723 [Streptomyces murinus]